MPEIALRMFILFGSLCFLALGVFGFVVWVKLNEARVLIPATLQVVAGLIGLVMVVRG